MRRNVIGIVGLLLVAALSFLAYKAHDAERRAEYQVSLAPHVAKAAQYINDAIKPASGRQEPEARVAELKALIEQVQTNAPASYADITNPVVNYLEASRAVLLRVSGMLSRVTKLTENLQSSLESLNKPLPDSARKEAFFDLASNFDVGLQTFKRDIEGLDQDLDTLKAAEELVKPLYPSVLYADDVMIASIKDVMRGGVDELSVMMSQIKLMLALLQFLS